MIHASLYIRKYNKVFDKKWSYKENRAPNTQEKVRRTYLSLLFHCNININVSSPKKSFCKYDFLKKSMITLLSLWIFPDANHYKNNQNDQKQVN